MNEVIHSIQSKKETQFEIGDIFIDKRNEYYILTDIMPKYAAICINDGNLWSDPMETADEAVNGLYFIGRNAKIVISFDPIPESNIRPRNIFR